MWWQLLVGVVAGLALAWVAVLLTLSRLARREPNVEVVRTALRLLPDLVRMLPRLAADPTLPRGVRIRLVLLTAYLVSPFDLVPDFIPLIGFADDAVVVALALRSVVRRAGPHALERHWTGDAAGLRVVARLAGIGQAEQTAERPTD